MRGTYLFVEATGFSDSVKSYFGADEAHPEFQSEMVAEPDKGSVLGDGNPLSAEQ